MNKKRTVTKNSVTEMPRIESSPEWGGQLSSLISMERSAELQELRSLLLRFADQLEQVRSISSEKLTLQSAIPEVLESMNECAEDDELTAIKAELLGLASYLVDLLNACTNSDDSYLQNGKQELIISALRSKANAITCTDFFEGFEE